MSKTIFTFFAIFLFCLTSIFSQDIIVKGKVFDDSMRPLGYVNIFIKSKNNIGTSSDLQGSFVFPFSDVTSKDTLVFSCIGYYNYYLPVASVKTQKELLIILDENIKTFEDISVNAKRSTVNEIIKKFNKKREEYMPENITKFEVFVRQFIKLDNAYYSLLESFFKVFSENQIATNGELLYLNNIEKNDPYDCQYNFYCPSLDFSVFLDYPKISKHRLNKYSLDTVVPFNNDVLIYVISEKYSGKSSFQTHAVVTANGDIIIEEIIQDTTENSKTEYSVTNKYYITNESKINKVIYETYYKNARIQEVREKGKLYYSRIICCVFEVEYKEVNGKIHPFRMKTIWGYEYLNAEQNHCITKNIITEYSVGKIEQNVVEDDTLNRNDFQNLNLYNTPQIIGDKYYEDLIIKDNLRQIVVGEIEK